MRDTISAFSFLAIGAAAGLASSPAAAAPVETQGATACSIGAFATDHDPKGTHVRAAPRADAPIVGRLPPLYYLSKDDYTGVEFKVLGSKDGWLLIRHAKYENTIEDAYAGPGWIWGGLAGLTVGDERLLAEPRADAPILVWLKDSERGWSGVSFHVTRIYSCQGPFAEIGVKSPARQAKERRGWVTRFCLAQLTTCDIPESDGPSPPEHYRFPD